MKAQECLRKPSRRSSRRTSLGRHVLRLEALEERNLLTICTVRNTFDDLNPESLRYCMTTLPHPDTITFELPLPAQIDIASAMPVIDWNLTIDGPGVPTQLTVNRSGSAQYSIFTVTSGVVTIRDLTVSNGPESLGVGIYNACTLTIDNDVIRDNDATGTPVPEAYTDHAPQVTVDHSTINNNRNFAVQPPPVTPPIIVYKAEGGGMRAICIGSCLNITSSTISRNHIFISGNVPQGQTADAIGGGLAAAGDNVSAPILTPPSPKVVWSPR
jgi:hypothetical protein